MVLTMLKRRCAPSASHVCVSFASRLHWMSSARRRSAFKLRFRHLLCVARSNVDRYLARAGAVDLRELHRSSHITLSDKPWTHATQTHWTNTKQISVTGDTRTHSHDTPDQFRQTDKHVPWSTQPHTSQRRASDESATTRADCHQITWFIWLVFQR